MSDKTPQLPASEIARISMSLAECTPRTDDALTALTGAILLIYTLQPQRGRLAIVKLVGALLERFHSVPP
jgi:hypothetical protein